MLATILNMFESFKPKQEVGNEPTNLGRRRVLGTIGGVGMVALSGVMVTGRVAEENDNLNTEDVTQPQVSSESVKEFEATQSEVLNQLVEALKSENKEVFNYALKYVYALREEKSALLERKTRIVAELTTSNNADPLQPFYLLEHNRINKSLDEQNLLIQAVENAVRQSPLYNISKETNDETVESEGFSLSDSVEKQKRTM